MVHSTARFRYDAAVSLRRNPVSIQTLVRLAPALLAIALYAITLYGTYVYDDVFIVQQDARVHRIDRWKRLWTTDYFDGGVDNLYRPLVSTSYALEWFIHGDRPWYFHAVNILLHALVCMTVAEFTRRCLSTPAVGSAPLAQASPETARRRRRPWTGESQANITALYAGLLFAAHPIHVEAVANIVGRAELACALAIFGGLIVLAKRPLTFARVCAVIILGIAGLLSKEHGLLQPLLWAFFLLLIWPRLAVSPDTESSTQTPALRYSEEPDSFPAQPGSSDYLRTGVGDSQEFRFPISPREKNDLKILLLVVTWLWAGYLICREHFLKFEWDRTFLDPTVQPMIKSVGIDRVLMPLVLLGHYTRLLFWPIHLSPDYGADVIGSVVHIGDPYLWIGGFTALILVLLVLFQVAQLFGKRSPSPGTPGEGGGEGDFEPKTARDILKPPHPNPLPEYRERGPELSENRAGRFILFCLLCLGVTYGVIGNIFTLIGTILAERLAYIPSAFALILLAMLIARSPRKIGIGLMTIILILCSIRTVIWARDWNDPLTLYRTSLENCPRSLQLHFLLAQEYHNAADEPQAQAVMARATEMYPSYWQAWMQRASHALDVGKLNDAEKYLKTAQDLEANPHLLVVRERLDKMVAAKKRPGAATTREGRTTSP